MFCPVTLTPCRGPLCHTGCLRPEARGAGRLKACGTKPRPMTARLRSALWGLRVFGPCSIADLSRRLGQDREKVYRSVYELRSAGLACREGEASYDISPDGRSLLETPAEPVTIPTETQMSLF